MSHSFVTVPCINIQHYLHTLLNDAYGTVFHTVIAYNYLYYLSYMCLYSINAAKSRPDPNWKRLMKQFSTSPHHCQPLWSTVTVVVLMNVASSNSGNSTNTADDFTLTMLPSNLSGQEVVQHSTAS